MSKKGQIFSSIIFSFLGLAAILCLYYFLIEENTKQVTNGNNSSYKNPIEEFSERTSLDTKWFEQTYFLPDSILGIHLDKKLLLLKTRGSEETICTYDNENVSNSIKIVKDTLSFDEFIKKAFSITVDHLSDITIDNLIIKLNATSQFVNEVKDSKINTRDKIFSLIYNEIVGGKMGQVAVIISKGKLKILKASDLKSSFIDLEELAKGLENVRKNDSLSAHDKYETAKDREVIPVTKRNNVNNKKDTLQQKIDNFLSTEDAIVLEKELPFQFVYLNFRKDSLYVGSIGHKVDTKSDTSVTNTNNEVKSNPTEIYYKKDGDGTLYNLPILPNSDKQLWGTIDKDIIRKAKLTEREFAQKYDLIPKNSNKLITTSIILLISLIIYEWLRLLYNLISVKKRLTVIEEGETTELHKDTIKNTEYKYSEKIEKLKSEIDDLKGQIKEDKTIIEDLNKQVGASKKKDKECDLLRTLFTDDPDSPYSYLKEKIESITETTDIEKFVDFCMLFGSKNSKKIYNKDIVLEQYRGTIRILDSFSESCNQIKDNDALTIKSIALATSAINKLALPLMELWRIKCNFSSKEFGDILKNFHNELINHLITKRLYNAYHSNKLGDFKKELKSLQEIANEQNKKEPSSYKLRIDEHYWQTMVDWSEKIAKGEEVKTFAELMCQYFIDDFTSKVKDIDSDSAEDRKWFFEYVLNIAFHTADFVEHVNNEKAMIYCYNYSLLINKLDFSKVTCKEYQHNHADKSTPFADSIYEIASDLKIKNLRFLIDKFQIKL